MMKIIIKSFIPVLVAIWNLLSYRGFFTSFIITVMSIGHCLEALDYICEKTKALFTLGNPVNEYKKNEQSLFKNFLINNENAERIQYKRNSNRICSLYKYCILLLFSMNLTAKIHHLLNIYSHKWFPILESSTVKK